MMNSLIIFWMLLFVGMTLGQSFATNPFNLGKVEYFSTKKSLKQRLEEMQKPMDWREPIIGADGKVNYYTPPEPVVRLLNEPSVQNAQAYMDWQKQKTERLLKAQEVLAQLQGSP